MNKSYEIALIGNVANNFFREAQLLNRSEHISATCYTNNGVSIPNTERPESDPLDLLENWREYTREVRPMFGIKLRMLFFPKRIVKKLKGVQSNLIAEAERADLRVFSGSELLIAQKFCGPYVIRPTGSDLTVTPSLSFREYWSMQKHNRKATLKDKVFWFYLRFHYRKAYYKASGIALSSEEPYQIALRTFMPLQAKIVNKIPLSIDTKNFKRVTERSSLLPKFVRDDDFIIFMPSRIMISSSEVHRKTGQWKASDVGLGGVKLFINSLSAQESRKIWLLIPDRTLSDELPKAKLMIHEMNLDKHTIWLKGGDPGGLTRTEMVPIYSMTSATLDDFGAGWYGSIAVESMACESPVITYLTEELWVNSNKPPMMIAQSPEEVAGHLEVLFWDRSRVRTIGQDSRRWVQQNHSEKAIIEAYTSILETIV